MILMDYSAASTARRSDFEAASIGCDARGKKPKSAARPGGVGGLRIECIRAECPRGEGASGPDSGIK